MTFFSSKLAQKNTAVFLLLVFSFTAVFSFLVLPAKKARATVPVYDLTVATAIGGFQGLNIAQLTTLNASNAKILTATEMAAYELGLIDVSTAATAVSTAAIATATGALAEKAAEDWLALLIRAAIYALLIELLQTLTQQIIDWINGNGAPKFITDWQSFTKDVLNEAGGKFVSENLGMGFLCQPFDMDIKIALATVPNFKDRAKCTLNDIGNFFSDFNDGGWKSWVSLSQPQNNMYGALLMSLDEKKAQEDAALKAATDEAIAAAGFLADKVCVQRTCCADGICAAQTGEWTVSDVKGNSLACSCDKWITKTPGKTIADMVSKIADQSRQMLSDQISLLTASMGSEGSRLVTPFITAILMAATNRLVTTGISTITGN